MKVSLRQVGTNMTELHLGVGDRIVLFSYETPVAVQYIHNVQWYIAVTEKFYSRTTARHIGIWTKTAHGIRCTVPQDTINALVSGECPDIDCETLKESSCV